MSSDDRYDDGFDWSEVVNELRSPRRSAVSTRSQTSRNNAIPQNDTPIASTSIQPTRFNQENISIADTIRNIPRPSRRQQLRAAPEPRYGVSRPSSSTRGPGTAPPARPRNNHVQAFETREEWLKTVRKAVQEAWDDNSGGSGTAQKEIGTGTVDSKGKGPARGVENVISAYEAELSCPVCLELFLLPQVLNPCGHSICADCIYYWLHQNNTGSTSCPSCRTQLGRNPTHIPNFSLQSTVDSHILALDSNGIEGWGEQGSKTLDRNERRRKWLLGQSAREQEERRRLEPQVIPIDDSDDDIEDGNSFNAIDTALILDRESLARHVEHIYSMIHQTLRHDRAEANQMIAAAAAAVPPVRAVRRGPPVRSRAAMEVPRRRRYRSPTDM